MMARAFYRDYTPGAKRSALVRRLHIVREDGKFPGRHGYCGIQVGPVKLSKAAVIDPMPTVAPLGLAWCGKCVGEHADRVGLINTFASVLATEGLS